MIEYSVIIPIKNEEENIIPLIEELEPIMNGLKKPWELICIDDGSTDQSLVLLKTLRKKKPYLHLIAFTQNFGQSCAFAAGFEKAKGTYLITLDGDRQNDPQDIPRLIEAMDGYDLVVGWRQNRQDTWQKRATSKLSNWVRSRICHDGMHDSACSLKIYRKDAAKHIKMFKGMHRFLPALFCLEGFKIREIPVNHRKRIKGKTNYTFFNRSLGPIIDLLAVRWMKKRALNYQIKQD